jgi:HK97 family phage major capsid protein
MSHSERLEKLKGYCKGISNEGLEFFTDFLNVKSDELSTLQAENDQLKRERGSLSNAPMSGSASNLLERELFAAIGEHANVFKSLASSNSKKETSLFSFETRSMTIGGNLSGDAIPGLGNENIPRPYAANHFQNLIGTTTVPTSSVVYMQESSPLSSSGSFGFQSEGASKAQVDYNVKTITAELEFLAAVVKISRQFLASIPDLQNYLSRTLAEDFKIALDNFIFQRLWTNAVAGASGESVAAAKLLDYVTQAGWSGRPPDGIAISPSSWAKVLKSAPGSAGTYSIPGGVQISPLGSISVFGYPVYPISSMPSGSVLIGNFRGGASIAQNVAFNVRTSDSNEDDFNKNMLSIRGESLLTLMVYQPLSFVSGTI